MAKLVGLVGSIVNKAGNFVFSTWKGIQVARVYQPNVADPRSDDQIAQRTKFDYCVQYSIALNNNPYLKHLWSLISPGKRSPINEFVSRNLLYATFESDNSLCTNKLIISSNNDYLKNLVLPGDQSCSNGVWALDGLDLSGCGQDPDGVLIVQIFQSNLLADPNQSPFRDARICVSYVQALSFPIASISSSAIYEDVFDICCPDCEFPNVCCNSSLWLIPVWSGGLNAGSDPKLITKAGTPLLACLSTCECSDPVFDPVPGYLSGQNYIFITTSAECNIYYEITSKPGSPPDDPPDPTALSTLYVDRVILGIGIYSKIKAIAIGAGCDSSSIILGTWFVDI